MRASSEIENYIEIEIEHAKYYMEIANELSP